MSEEYCRSSDAVAKQARPRDGTADVHSKDDGFEFLKTIESARNGAPSALGTLLDGCRKYLLLVANKELGQSIRTKIAPSDLVQETFLQAQKIFDRFEGRTQEELFAWLKQILEFKIAQAARKFAGTEMRAVSLEVPIEEVEGTLTNDQRRIFQRSPDSQIQLNEKTQLFRDALDRLPTDYRIAIELRSLEHKSFAELGQALDRTAAAARMVWVRALEKLSCELQAISGQLKTVNQQPNE